MNYSKTMNTSRQRKACILVLGIAGAIALGFLHERLEWNRVAVLVACSALFVLFHLTRKRIVARAAVAARGPRAESLGTP